MGKKIHLDICDFCGKVEEDFKSRAAFLEHYRVHQGVEYSYEECDASFCPSLGLNTMKGMRMVLSNAMSVTKHLLMSQTYIDTRKI